MGMCFMGLLPDIEMINTSSPAIKHRSSKQPGLISMGGPTYHLREHIPEYGTLSRLRPPKRLFRTQVLSQFAVMCSIYPGHRSGFKQYFQILYVVNIGEI